MNRNLRAFRHHSYLFVWMGSLLSNIGNWMENVGQGWVVASQTHSAFHVEFLSFAQFLPVIFLAVPAGIIADTFDRKKVLIIAQTTMALIAGSLAVLAHMGLAGPWVIIGITFLEGAAWAMNGPAWQSILPRLVPRKDMESAIALNSIQYNLARLVGPAVAGVIVARYGFAYAFDINALSFLAVIGALSFANLAPETFREKKLSKRPPFKEARQWVWSHRGARRIVISIAIFAILSAPLQGLMPYFASDVLRIGPKGLGSLLACLGTGAVTGAFLLGQLPSNYPRHHLIPLSIFMLGVLLMTYSQAPNSSIAFPLLFVTGIFWLWTMISCNTAMQLLVPDKIRGRVMSLLLLANVGMLPFGHMAGGLLAHSIGPRDTLLICSVLLIFTGGLTLWKRVPEIDGVSRRLRRVRLKNFFSEVILASSHRAEALSLDNSTPDSAT